MHPALEHLIHLQQIETESDRRRRWLTDLPQLLGALDARVTARAETRAAVAQRLADNQAARRGLEKELSVVQGRLTKYKDQLMEVKTNKEYTAMQHEIATAEQGVRGFEDQMLELLVQADELAAELKAAEAALTAETTQVAAERTTLDADRLRTESEFATLAAERAGVEKLIPPEFVRLFGEVAVKRRGLAVAIIKGGHCSGCQVRLRPQMLQQIRLGNGMSQCESCSRILYLPPDAPIPDAAPPA